MGKIAEDFLKLYFLAYTIIVTDVIFIDSLVVSFYYVLAITDLQCNNFEHLQNEDFENCNNVVNNNLQLYSHKNVYEGKYVILKVV